MAARLKDFDLPKGGFFAAMRVQSKPKYEWNGGSVILII